MRNLSNRVDRLEQKRPERKEPLIMETTYVSGPPGGTTVERLGQIWVEGRGKFNREEGETEAEFRGRAVAEQ